MIKELKKSIGYICPGCSAISVCEKNPFDFSGAVTCPECGNECISILPKQNSYIVHIDCPVCDDTHTFTLRKAAFWQSKRSILTCPETGLGIFFSGDRKSVEKGLYDQEQMIEEVQEEFGIENELSLIFDTVNRINELAKSGNVFCTCGSTAISIEIDNDNVLLTCRTCGRKKNIPITETGLDSLLLTSAIVLD